MSAAAAVWEIPASSLACRISAGVGLVDDKFFTEFFGVGFYVGVKELLIGIDRAVNFSQRSSSIRLRAASISKVLPLYSILLVLMIFSGLLGCDALPMN